MQPQLLDTAARKINRQAVTGRILCLPDNSPFPAAWTKNHPEAMERLSMAERIPYAAERIFLSEIQTDVFISQNIIDIGPADAGCHYPVILSSDLPAGR